MKPMLLAARQQILRARWAEHHVILSPCGQNETSCDDLMEAASPLRENVTCSTPTGIARDLPAFANLRATFHGRKFSAPETVNVGAMRWCWNSCDGPYLHWYKLHGQTLSHVRFFWFLEWDVVWTGNIASVLRTWNSLQPDQDSDVITAHNRMASSRLGNASANASADAAGQSAHEGPDLLCADPAFASTRWIHREKRDEQLVPLNSTYHCVTEIYRLTHRLLRIIIDFSSQERGAMFCEMRAASICAMQPWCRIRSFVDRVHMPLLFSHRMAAKRVINGGKRSQHVVERTRRYWVNSFLNARGVSAIQDADLHNMSEPMLFHAFKWSNESSARNGSTYAERLTMHAAAEQGLPASVLRSTLDNAQHWSWA